MSVENELRGEAAIHALPSSKISELIRVIDKVREGRMNMRDVSRKTADSINRLMSAYGMVMRH